MRNEQYYREKFKDYPDVVTLEQFREMLGGIGHSTARKLMRAKKVKHFYIRDAYMIPKEYVIDYVTGEHYAEYKYGLKVQI
ncbi:DNA-binding protein [Jeotgalibaca arthritidis]|uniref:DNA-binding protein n=1 Tax=Jeotgalibaca arthritidis TaxID=1868794 RepID=A0A6G7K7K8_9LACT|nr:DNA-binding protein [Jeotgalibaca arthritidis]QII81235.1 DNA-binding protein [Jeotgalibaca arthritidis]